MARGEGEQMTTILPLCDNWELDGRDVDRAHRGLEKRAIKAEAEVARLRREVAWLRSGGSLKLKQGRYSGTSTYADVEEYLASSPPEGWEPA